MVIRYLFALASICGVLLLPHALGAIEAPPAPLFNEAVLENVTFQVGAWVQTEPQIDDESESITFRAKGLPKGLTCDPVTGVISGVPLKPGKSKATITGTDSNGRKTVTKVTLDVEGFPTEWVDEYQGLFDTDVGSDLKIRGLVTLQVTGLGSLSGKLNLGSQTFSLRGTLVKNEEEEPYEAELVISPNTHITLRVETSSQGLTCFLDEGENPDESWQVVVDALHRAYDRQHPATWAKGVFTVASQSPAQGFPHNGKPIGDGIYSVTVTADGRVLLKGVLADGTAVTWSCLLLREEQPTEVIFPIYLHPYKEKKLPSGLLMGLLKIYTVSEEWDPEFPAERGISDYLASHLLWEKAPSMSDKERLYPEGFSMELNTVGQPYRRPRTGYLLMGAQLGNLNTALLFHAEGVASFDHYFTITRSNGIKMLPVDPESPASKVSLKVNAGTGFFSGSFTLKEGRRTGKFKGVILAQGGFGTGEGYGHFLLADLPEAGVKTLPPIKSGGLRWATATPEGSGGGGPTFPHEPPHGSEGIPFPENP